MTQMSVHVVMPYRATRSRAVAAQITSEWWRHNLTPQTFRHVDTRHEPFSLAACRNEGVRQLAQDELRPMSDVVVLADADTLPEWYPVERAITAARETGGIHLPYEEYRQLGQDGTRAFMTGMPLRQCAFNPVPGAVSGVLVTTIGEWLRLGGQDPAFLGWGYEDAAFHHVHEVMWGRPFSRHEGAVYALDHEPAIDKGSSFTARNLLRCEDYFRCATPAEIDRLRYGPPYDENAI